jgi:hypothetical protein
MCSFWNVVDDQSIRQSESAFNAYALFPVLPKLCQHASNAKFGGIQFLSGEIHLLCTQKNGKGEGFKADGIVRTNEMKLELMLLETSGAFAKHDRNKFAFDYVKGSCCLRMMLSALANRFKHGSCSTFAKVSVYFVHARGKTLVLEIEI